MMDSSDIKQFAATLGLDCVGIAPAELPQPHYAEDPPCPLAAGTGTDRYEPRRLLPSCHSVIVILFPYYTAQTEAANLSIYCRSADYHTIVRSYLERIASYLQQQYPGSEQHCVIDTSPLSDRWLAYQAGLGFWGDNRCLINDTYGSYVFIGSILTSLPLLPDKPLQKECRHCGACRTACPGQCFSDDAYDYSRCKSYITQKKGSLTLPEIQCLKKTPIIFGCDACQELCPHNADAKATPLPEFYHNRLTQLYCSDIESLSNKQFQQIFGNRAFAWRGKKVLLRNMKYAAQSDASVLTENRNDGKNNI